MLEIKNLKVSVNEKQILNGINLKIEKGEVSCLMGPNGSGKSTLAFALMGHPRYKVEDGSIFFNGEDLTKATPTQRAKSGMFLSFQYPSEIPGVTVENFLRTAYNSTHAQVSVMEFHKLLEQKMAELKIEKEFSRRHLNEGFSGGEKKKTEILQMSVLNPKLAILDETDSGLDVDALKTVAQGVNRLINPDLGILLITHYQRILKYIAPHSVHVMADGKIIKSGGAQLALKIEQEGYDWIHGNLQSKA